MLLDRRVKQNGGNVLGLLEPQPRSQALVLSAPSSAALPRCPRPAALLPPRTSAPRPESAEPLSARLVIMCNETQDG
jgi:hypothetical protein